VITVDGVEVYRFSGTVTPPDDPSFGGYAVVAHNQADGANHSGDVTLALFGKTDVTWQTPWTPVLDSQPTYDLYFVSYDVNNQQNTLVPGITPRVTGLHPVPQTTGSIKGSRLNPATLDPSLAILAAKLAINDLGVLTSKLGALQVTNPKLALLSVDANILANSSLTAIKYANLSIGTAAISLLAVGDAQISGLAATKLTAGTLVAGVVYAGPIFCSQLVAGTITAAISMISPTLVIASGGLTVNIDSANYVKVSSAGGQSQVLDTTIRTQTASNNRFVQLSSGGQIIGQSLGGTTFSLDANGGLVLQGNPVVGFDRVTIVSGGGQSQVLATTIRTQNAANDRYVQISAGGQIIGQSTGGSTFSLDGNGGLNIQGNQVVGARQTDPGVPAGFADAAAQNWCVNMRLALKAHGLI